MISAQVARRLLESGVNPDGAQGMMSPLEAACQAHSLEVVDLLLDRGADPNGPNPTSSPLNVICHFHLAKPYDIDWATFDKHRNDMKLRIAKLLLDRGADPDGKSDDGSGRPLDGACGRLNNIDLARILLDGGANPHKAPDELRSPLR